MDDCQILLVPKAIEKTIKTRQYQQVSDGEVHKIPEEAHTIRPLVRALARDPVRPPSPSDLQITMFITDN